MEAGLGWLPARVLPAPEFSQAVGGRGQRC